MLNLEDLKAISKFFKGTEKKYSNEKYKLVIEGMFYFNVPENCIPELLQGSMDIRITIFPGFPRKCPQAFIKDPALRLFPHIRIDTGEICPPNNVKWASKPTFKAFLEYLNKLLGLIAANCAEKPTDYYELPHFPVSNNNFSSYMVFDGSDNLSWLKVGAKVGLFCFTRKGGMLRVIQIDVTPNNAKEYCYGVFIWVPKELIIKYKKPPISFGELNQALENFGFSLLTIIDKLKQHNLLNLKKVPIILGFPIRIKNNDTANDVHWQLFEFNNEAFIILLRKRRKKSKGKYKEQNYTDAMNDFLSSQSNEKISYRHSYNCSKQSLYSRIGFMDERKSYAVFGCGAIGSHLAFEFVRAGHKKVCLIDSDYLEPGNICRHVLDFNGIHRGKAVGLSEKLKSVNPWGEFTPYVRDIFSFNIGTEEIEKISTYDFWIDAGLPALTSHYLASLAAHYKKRMISCYITDKAKYLIFIVSGFECNPNNLVIAAQLVELLRGSERNELRDCFEALTKIEASDAIMPSIGCYSRTFQASGTQISSVAAIAHSTITNFINKKDASGGFKVYGYDEQSFTYNLLLDQKIKNELA